MSEKEPFHWTKQGSAFADVTRWLKDAFSAFRGNFALVLIVAAIFGLCYGGARIANHFFPKKETALVSSVSNTGAGKVEVVKIEKQKNSFLGLF